jgi:hypothetical protein
VVEQLIPIGGRDVLVCTEDGPPVGVDTVLDLIGDALGQRAEWVVQKLANYRLRLAVLGDVTAHTSASDALRDWVREANRGGQVWFVADTGELAERFAAAG